MPTITVFSPIEEETAVLMGYLNDLGDREQDREQWSNAEKFNIDIQFGKIYEEIKYNKKKKASVLDYIKGNFSEKSLARHDKFNENFNKQIKKDKPRDRREKIIDGVVFVAFLAGLTYWGSTLIIEMNENKEDIKKPKTEQKVNPETSMKQQMVQAVHINNALKPSNSTYTL